MQVCIYAFDCLYLNDESLISKPFAERRRCLHESFTETIGEFQFATHKDSYEMLMTTAPLPPPPQCTL